MNRLLLIICLTTLCFANVHEGLKKAVDEGDLKTAKTLIEKIGVKDIYCPSNLSFDVAYQLYGNIFEEDPSKMWDNCDSMFLKKAEVNLCKESVPLCKMLLHKTDVYQWNPYLEDIIKAKLNFHKEKRNEFKEERVKTSKKECLLALETEKKAAQLYVSTMKSVMCDPKDDASRIICPLLFAAIEDSIQKAHKAIEKMCKTKPTKAVKKEMELEVETNPFLYEIEYYGTVLSFDMRNPFIFDKKKLDIYRELKKNTVAEHRSINDIGNDITGSRLYNKKLKYQKTNFVGACIAYPNIDSLLNRSTNFRMNGYSVSCDKELKLNNINKAFLLTSPKAVLMKELVSLYAKSGKIPDSLTAYSCRLDSNIDQELYKLTEINILNCKEMMKKYENHVCNESFQDSLAISGDGAYFICYNGYWYKATPREVSFGSCNEKKHGKIETESVNGRMNKIICDSTGWRNATTWEIDLYQQSCGINELGKVLNVDCEGSYCDKRSYVCEKGSWRKAREYEDDFGACNDKINNDLIKQTEFNKYIQYFHCNQGLWRRIWKDDDGRIREYGIDSLNLIGKVVVESGKKMVIDDFDNTKLFRQITPTEQKLKKMCLSTNIGESIVYKGERFYCEQELLYSYGRKRRTYWMSENMNSEIVPAGEAVLTKEYTKKASCPGKWKVPSSVDYKKLFEKKVLKDDELYGRSALGGMRVMMKTSDGMVVDEKEQKIVENLPYAEYVSTGNRCILY